MDSIGEKVCRKLGFQKIYGLILDPDSIKTEKRVKLLSYVDSIEKVRIGYLKKDKTLHIALIKNLTLNECIIINKESKHHFSTILSVFSFALMFYFFRGVYKWKKHYQRYQDAILMKQAGVSEEEIQKYLKN